MQLLAPPGLQEPLGVLLCPVIAGLRQILEHLIEIHTVHSPFETARLLRLLLALAGPAACALRCRLSMAVESRDTWPTSSSPRASSTRAACICFGRRDCENSANARENVASLGISPTRDQPHSLRSVESTFCLSIRWRVVGRSHTALAMKARSSVPRDPPVADPHRSRHHRQNTPP